MKKLPVFIVGLSRRSGTNYLYELLALHPDCVKSKHEGEDFILIGADRLESYYQKVFSYWSSDWHNSRERFMKCIEDGIVNYLDPGEAGKFVVCKTPSAVNADRFDTIFSEGYMIVITRNGQALTESFSRSFNHRFDDALRVWMFGARQVMKILNNKSLMSSGRVMIIRYEELYANNRTVMSRLLEFLKLDKNLFDFEKSAEMDVVGSSTFKKVPGDVSWKPIPKDASFDPLNRFSNWSRWQHYRFNWVAGKASGMLGYPLFHESQNPVYYIYNIAYELYDFLYRFFRRAGIVVKSFLGGKKSMRNAFKREIN